MPSYRLLVLLSQAPRSATPYPRNGAFRTQGNFPPYAYQATNSSPNTPSTATSSQFLFSLNSPDIPPPIPSEPELAMRKLLDALASATQASTSAAAISAAKLQASTKDQELIAEQQYKQLRQQQKAGGVYGFGWGLGSGLGGSATVDTARSPAPSFLSGGAPRDRRGRVGTRPPAMHLTADTDLDGSSVMSMSATSQATVTPTSTGPKAVRHKPAVLQLRGHPNGHANGAGIDGVGGSAVSELEVARERDRLLLESLRLVA